MQTARAKIREAARDAVALVLLLVAVAAVGACGSEASSVAGDSLREGRRPEHPRCPDLPAPGSIVINGSFEKAGAISWCQGCTSLSGISLPVGESTALPGWTVADNPVMVMGSNYFPASDGLDCLALDACVGPGSVFQDLATEPAVSYVISFAMAADPWNPETDSLDVYWGGERAGSFTAVSTGSYPDNTISWTRVESPPVTAASATTRLQFVDTDSNNVAPLIDDVRVVPYVAGECH